MSRTAVLPWFGALAVVFGIHIPRRIDAAIGDCGQPVAAGPTAVDALEVLRTATGSSDCGGHDPCICDVNSSSSVTASDALTVLRKAVGQNVTLNCSCGPTTTGGQTTTTVTGTTTTVTTTSTLPPALDTKEMHLLAKAAGTYAQADLPGTWEVNVLATGPGGPYWLRGTFTIVANGDTSGTLHGSGGENAPITANLQLSAQGGVTCTTGCEAIFAGAVDSGKTVFVATTINNHGTALLFVGARRGTSYTTADLAGTWRLHSLVSGPNSGRWSTGTITIDSNGNVNIDSVDSDGVVHTVTEKYSIDTDGIITCSNGCRPDFRAVLDAGKTVVVATSKNPDDTAKLNVLTRVGAPYVQPDLTADWAWTTLAAGPDLPLWQRGRVQIDSNGALSGTLTDETGGNAAASGTLTITSDGVITSNTDVRLRCALDSDRTLVACIDSR